MNPTFRKCWKYTPNIMKKDEVVIKEVVFANDSGLLVWEKDAQENHSIHFRNYKNELVYTTDLKYLATTSRDDFKLKLNDIIECDKELIIIDMTKTMNGTGVLDIVNYRSGTLVKRLEHDRYTLDVPLFGQS